MMREGVWKWGGGGEGEGGGMIENRGREGDEEEEEEEWSGGGGRVRREVIQTSGFCQAVCSLRGSDVSLRYCHFESSVP